MEIYLTVGHGDWLPVPFFRPEDGESHPYVDLRENPQKIEDIPEAKDFPELQDFFRAVNGENSFFRTLASITMPREIPSPKSPYEMRSYVDVTFVPWEWGGNAAQNFVIFFQFTEFIHGLKTNQGLENLAGVSVYLNLKPSRNQDLGIPFWCMEWWIISRGKTQEEAREGWRATLQLLQQFLLEISPSTEEEYRRIQKVS